jgi:23S rRNA (cytidine1920-2'-O)/16S rRNA (cytidine1409-2'-O)-methyltransferase
MTKKRLDLVVVEKALVDTLSKARARIIAGDVIVDDKRVDKPGTLIDENAPIRLRGDSLPYVSRGGLKLKAAIDKWPSPILGAVCIDVGASTGGFTDVLLQEGAKQVYAVDVGYNQLAFGLRKDPRVVVMEKTHILKLDPTSLSPRPNIATIDVSFISLLKVLPKVAEILLAPGAIYALIKPQFEVAPGVVGKGGIVRDEKARLDCVERVLKFANEIGLSSDGYIESPIQGADGNVEYLVVLRKT